MIGALVDEMGRWDAPLILAVVVCLLGVLGWLARPPIEPPHQPFEDFLDDLDFYQGWYRTSARPSSGNEDTP